MPQGNLNFKSTDVDAQYGNEIRSIKTTRNTYNFIANRT